MLDPQLLQQWYSASDAAIEEAVSDRLSFRRFAGRALQDAVPDHSTISRFRKEVAERGLARRLFAEVNRQLEGRGLPVKKGMLIDASIIEGPARRPWSDAGAWSKTDADAAWTRKGKRGAYFFRLRVAHWDGRGLWADPGG